MVSILVVEDNNNLRMLMSDRLEMEGYEIFQAQNGKKHLKY